MTDMERFGEMLKAHKRIVFFGGAGVSTESNIPDFRGAGGMYTRSTGLPWTPEEMVSHHFYKEHPREFYTMFRSWNQSMLEAKPNRAHYVLAELERLGKLSAVVTQNIDGLHQRAGSRNVLELHGSILRNTCQDCGAVYPVEEFMSLCTPVPRCSKCGGIIKPDVVLYEEALDMDVIRDAVDEIASADMLIIGGTSLVVYPAAGFIDYFEGNDMVLINRDPTPKDRKCTLVFRDSVGEVLEKGLDALEQK